MPLVNITSVKQLNASSDFHCDSAHSQTWSIDSIECSVEANAFVVAVLEVNGMTGQRRPGHLNLPFLRQVVMTLVYSCPSRWLSMDVAISDMIRTWSIKCHAKWCGLIASFLPTEEQTTYPSGNSE